MRQNLRYIIVAIQLFSLLGCSQVNFGSSLPNAQNSAVSTTTPVQAPPTPTAPPAPICTVQNVSRMTKIIFVVDTSGSNILPTKANYGFACLPTDSFYSQCAPPTDPNKTFRTGAIQQFFTTYQGKTNFQWEFITFAGTSAHALMNQANNDQVPEFATNPASFQTAINSFATETDGGATPYGAALAMAAQAISSDPDLNSAANPQYEVVMLTDGFPTDFINTNGTFNQAALNADISSLLNTAKGRVYLNTVYYGQVQDPTAVSLLANMAAQGGGEFNKVSDTSSGISIDDLIQKSICN